MTYTVEVGGRVIEVTIEHGIVRVDGRPVEAQLMGLADSAIRRLQRGPSSRTMVAARGDERGTWTMLLGGDRVATQVLTKRDLAIRAARRQAGGGTGGGTLKAPMPGMVVRVLVQEGASVEVGQGLVVLEAMKMENELKATGPGVVTTIHVTAGTRVEKGAALLLVS